MKTYYPEPLPHVSTSGSPARSYALGRLELVTISPLEAAHRTAVAEDVDPIQQYLSELAEIDDFDDTPTKVDRPAPDRSASPLQNTLRRRFTTEELPWTLLTLTVLVGSFLLGALVH